MNTSQIESLAKALLEGCYEFETKAYNDAIEVLTKIDEIDEPLYYLTKMSESNDYSVVFALSYILENISYTFIADNKDIISSIILNAVNKKYYRADFYFLEPLVSLMSNDNEYLCYLSLLESKYSMVQNKAISYLLNLGSEHYAKLDALNSLNFRIFNEKLDTLDKEWFSKVTKDLPDFYQKIVATAIYRKVKDKSFIYSLSQKNDAELFDYIYLSLI